MIYAGQASVDFLAVEVKKTDPAASSHWRKYHSEFEFSGDRFAGLQGFGGCKPPYRGLRRIVHQVLQRPYRRMGANLPEFDAMDALAAEITTRQERAYDLDVLRQVLTVAFLKDKVANRLGLQSTGCVIGDGFASMTTLLLASGAAGRVVLINLSKTLLVDLWYLKKWMGTKDFESGVDLVVSEDGLVQALAKPLAGKPRVVAIQAEHHELLRKCPIDFAVNIASLQEMDPPAVAAYFADLRSVAVRRPLSFYCCNREEKTLPDGTVVRFSEYPWRATDVSVVDELCPWHQQYYTIKPPFYRPYDGPIRHRLATLA